jgi:DNA-binding NarL/FixJ family response regulator
MSRPRVLLADDHVLLLEAFEKLLTPEFEVVGKATDGRLLLAMAQRLRPEAAVLDVMMPWLNGLDAARQLRLAQPHIGLVFLTMIEDAEIAAETVRLRGCGYVLKRSAASELVTALREVLQGRSYVTTLMTGTVVDALVNRGRGEEPPELTLRQREVLQLLAEGRSMKEVASILNITARTVAFHKYQIMRQLQITTTAQLIQFAVKQHIVS